LQLRREPCSGRRGINRLKDLGAHEKPLIPLRKKYD